MISETRTYAERVSHLSQTSNDRSRIVNNLAVFADGCRLEIGEGTFFLSFALRLGQQLRASYDATTFIPNLALFVAHLAS